MDFLVNSFRENGIIRIKMAPMYESALMVELKENTTSKNTITSFSIYGCNMAMQKSKTIVPAKIEYTYL